MASAGRIMQLHCRSAEGLERLLLCPSSPEEMEAEIEESPSTGHVWWVATPHGLAFPEQVAGSPDIDLRFGSPSGTATKSRTGGRFRQSEPVVAFAPVQLTPLFSVRCVELVKTRRARRGEDAGGSVAVGSRRPIRERRCGLPLSMEDGGTGV